MAVDTAQLTALGDPTRRTIFELIAERPRSVVEITRQVPVSQSAVSQHLKVLRDSRLVRAEPKGASNVYHVDPHGLGQMRAWLDRFWSKTLAAYKVVVEQPPKEFAMNTRVAVTSVKQSIVVEAPIARAFKVFTEQFGSFKPPEHNMLGVEIAETVFEPRVGGHIYDRGTDGSECRWARVLAYEPPDRVLLSWDISPQWQIETDPERTSEWEVRFTAETPNRTRVELEHRKLERHGDGWEGVRDGVAGDQGWPLYLRRYSDLLSHAV
jgi:DNA-binding transcriptional ArsR family regulator